MTMIFFNVFIKTIEYTLQIERLSLSLSLSLSLKIRIKSASNIDKLNTFIRSKTYVQENGLVHNYLTRQM